MLLLAFQLETFGVVGVAVVGAAFVIIVGIPT